MQWQRQQQQQQQSNANDQLPSASLQKSCTRHANPQQEQQLPTISSSKNSSGSSNISSSSSSNLAPTTNCHQPLFKSLAQGTPTPSGSFCVKGLCVQNACELHTDQAQLKTSPC